MCQSEDTVKRAAAHKKNCFNKNNNLRSTYENKCREADKAEETNNRLTSNPQTKPKELTQAARKMEVTKQSASNADLTYQESVRNLEEARHLWEREMEVLCKVNTFACTCTITLTAYCTCSVSGLYYMYMYV